MLIWRLTLGAAIIAALTGLCWLDWHAAQPGIWLFPVAMVLAVLAAGEAATLAPAPQSRGATLSWIVLGTVLVVGLSCIPLVWSTAPAIGPIGWPALGLAAGLLVPIVGAVLSYQGPGPARVNLAYAAFAITYVGLPMAFLVYLRMLGNPRGMVALISVIVTVKMGDIGAYTVGRLVGRHRLAPALSPGKTWEGVAGGVVLACFGAWLTLGPLAQSAGIPSPQPLVWIAYGLLLNTAGVVGDLAESLLKRDAGVKDSSRYVPGFGGVLDLLDSLLLAAPVGYALWQLAI